VTAAGLGGDLGLKQLLDRYPAGLGFPGGEDLEEDVLQCLSTDGVFLVPDLTEGRGRHALDGGQGDGAPAHDGQDRVHPDDVLGQGRPGGHQEQCGEKGLLHGELLKKKILQKLEEPGAGGQAVKGRRHEVPEQRMRVQRPALELGMELDPHKPRMVGQLHDLGQGQLFVLAHHPQAGFLEVWSRR
jgi:hypothetical protein